MKKIFLKTFLILFLFIPFLISALENPTLHSKYYGVYDLTDDKMLFSLNSDVKTEVASLTKIMTVLVAIENISDLDDTVTITNSILNTVSWDASVAGLEVGDVVTYRDLLYATMLPSGADAANALAISIAGSIDGYVELMNAKADSLNLGDTHYENVTGLDEDNHYSSVNDVIKLLKYSLNNNTFREIYTTKSYTLTNGLKVSASINFYNKVMDLDTSLILGSKTGFTDDAGYCISIYFKSDDHDLVAVTLNATRVNDNYYNVKDAVDIVDFVNDNFGYQTVLNKNEAVTSIPVYYSNIDEYDVVTKDAVKVFLPDDYDEELVSFKYNGLNELSYKNSIDEKLGTVDVYYDDVLLTTVDVFLLSEINANYFKIIWAYKWYIILAIVVLYIIFSINKKSKKRKKVRRTFSR